MNKILIIDDDRELCALIKRSVQTENIAADFCNTAVPIFFPTLHYQKGFFPDSQPTDFPT